MIENLCDNVLFFNFAIEMKKWLKYLIPILVIVASLGATCKYNTSSQDTLSCFFLLWRLRNTINNRKLSAILGANRERIVW